MVLHADYGPSRTYVIRFINTPLLTIITLWTYIITVLAFGPRCLKVNVKYIQERLQQSDPTDATTATTMVLCLSNCQLLLIIMRYAVPANPTTATMTVVRLSKCQQILNCKKLRWASKSDDGNKDGVAFIEVPANATTCQPRRRRIFEETWPRRL